MKTITRHPLLKLTLIFSFIIPTFYAYALSVENKNTPFMQLAERPGGCGMLKACCHCGQGTEWGANETTTCKSVCLSRGNAVSEDCGDKAYRECKNGPSNPASDTP